MNLNLNLVLDWMTEKTKNVEPTKNSTFALPDIVGYQLNG